MATAQGWGRPPRKYRELPLPNSAYVTDGGSMGDPRMLSASSKCVSTHSPKPTPWSYIWQRFKETGRFSLNTTLKYRGQGKCSNLTSFMSLVYLYFRLIYVYVKLIWY